MNTAINVEALGRTGLKRLIKAAEARMALIEKRAPAAAVRKQILAYAAKNGYSIHELFGVGPWESAPVAVKSRRGPSRVKSIKLPPLYRHPDDKTLTWTGRGSKPRWLAAFLAAGRELGEFKLKQVYKVS